jgi:hypothetical protein
VIWDTSNGISCFLPNKSKIAKTNDFGREATLVENITFSNIQMNEIYGSAIYFHVGDDPDTLFEGIRNITFDNINCTCLRLPHFCGREGGAIENISFNNCVFEKCKESDFPGNRKRHGAVNKPNPSAPVMNVVNLECNNTKFIIR